MLNYHGKNNPKKGKAASISDPKGTTSRRDSNSSNHIEAATAEETSVCCSSLGHVELASLRTGYTFREA